MSGFEVAGLILGVVPLTIAALEQYRTAHEMLRYFNHKSLYIDRLIQALEEQKFCLESEFDIVLRASGFQEQDISTISGGLQTILLRSDVAEELGQYLGRGYDPYRKALIRCETSLGEIVRNIGGLVPGCPSGDLKEVLRANESKEGKYQFKKRIKFSLKKDELERQISELIEATNTLRRLREISASLNDNGIQSSSRTVARFAIFLQRIQKHANSLYGAISQRLASGCHHEHGTKFYLEGQSAVFQKRLLPIKFKLAIEALEARTIEGNLRHEVCVEVLEGHTAKYGLGSQQPEQSKVKFDLPDIPKSSDPLITEVENLCLSLDQARQESKILKVFLSQHGGLCSCHMSPIPSAATPSSNSTYEMITLEQILLQTSSDKPARVKWNLIQRMNLSFNLASSLLQLYSTPWLSEPWTKRTICFWRFRPSSQANDMGLIFEADHPFIIHTFSEAPVARQTYKVDPRHQLLDLGIVLLEIRHKRSFESWASVHGFTLHHSYGIRYNAASSWLRDSIGELEPSYFDAAARCIECTFQTRSAIPDWEDVEFRKSVCELVIKPLWSNCSTMVM